MNRDGEVFMDVMEKHFGGDKEKMFAALNKIKEEIDTETGYDIKKCSSDIPYLLQTIKQQAGSDWAKMAKSNVLDRVVTKWIVAQCNLYMEKFSRKVLILVPECPLDEKALVEALISVDWRSV